jgi:light-regulated signal transduction histidine kinase (bacteriophytochrome)
MHRSQCAEDEIKALNRHLEHRLDELAEVNRELEAFSYSVSHDLRGPLSRIAGFSQALRESNADRIDQQGLTYLDRIENSSRRMSMLVEDLLNFSRLTRVEMRFSAVDLSAMMNALAADLKAREPGRAAEFAIAEDVTAWGDPELLRAVMQNLLENAWKFTHKHPAARIEFGITNGATGPVYYLRDDGAGFDMEQRDRLFSPFQRLHGAKEFEGTGIGLATVDRIIRRHGGRIWAESEVERGATFFFTLNREGGQ